MMSAATAVGGNHRSRHLMSSLLAADILDSIGDGVYVTDTNRVIVFWNRAAERISGWTPEEVIGRSCSDGILIHVDKDGNKLCNERTCPLYQAIISDTPSLQAVRVFAGTKSGKRVPVSVTVAPVHDERGTVVGGVQIFRDLREKEEDLARAHRIHQQTLELPVLTESQVAFSVRHFPHDLIGGDFVRLESIGPDRVAGMVADVAGEGVAAALYAKQLASLWEALRTSLPEPGVFFGKLNKALASLNRSGRPFATGIVFLVEPASGQVRYVNAGHPSPVLLRKKGPLRFLEERGPGLGLSGGQAYAESTLTLKKGETLVAYTDGAIDLFSGETDEPKETGWARALQHCGIGDPDFHFDRLEEVLFTSREAVRLPDDLTLLRVHRTG